MTLKLNTFHEGNCLELMRRIPSESVGTIVTSPPYNIRNSTGGGMRPGSRSHWQAAKLRNGYSDHSDDMPRDEYVAWQRECLREMLRILKNDGAIFYVHKRRVQGGLEEDPKVDILYDFPVRQTITWQRSGGINFNSSYPLPTTECIYMICKSKKFRLASPDPARPKAMCALGDVWTIPQERSNPHPAPFPVEIPLRCIRMTNARVVLDPFTGSGTTALAAEHLGRDWIGIDVSEDYVKLANERLERWRSMTPEQQRREIFGRSLSARIRKLKRELKQAKREQGKLLEYDPEE